MTCIVGLIHEGKVWLGGDRAEVTDRHYLVHVAAPKVFRRGDMVMGYTSSFRMGQLLQYRLEIPDRAVSQPLDEWMVVAFAEAVRECLKKGGYTKIDSGRETVGIFLVGIAGRLFMFDDDHNILETDCGFAAVGDGLSVAQGSLYTSAEVDVGPKQRLLWALEAASRFVTGVRAPFDVICEGEDVLEAAFE